MKKHENNLKLDAWDYVPGKNPIGDMAVVHIPTENISWLAHSGAGRLDIGLAGGVVHLLERDEVSSGDQKATKDEMARARFNRVGSAYWIEQEISELYEKLEIKLEIRCRCQTLEKFQIENALRLREILTRICINYRLVKLDVDALQDGFYKSINEWETKEPKGYAQYKAFGQDCAVVFYMVYETYQLFPAWIEKKALADLENVIRSLVPFTAMALGELKGEDNKKFEEKIASAIKAIDALFPTD